MTSDYAANWDARAAKSKLKDHVSSVVPAIFIEWVPGMVPEPKFGEFEVAIWNDGRIIWRDQPVVWDRRGETWGLNKGTYFEGKIDPKAVAGVMSKVRKTDVFTEKSWNGFPPDASYHSMHLVTDGHSTQVNIWSKTSRSQDEIGKRYRAIEQLIRPLIPKKGKATQRPTEKTQEKWIVRSSS